MGVPKFYRWLSERYPLMNQIISVGDPCPEVDNFYMDMNGIIHFCTHPHDDDTLNNKSKEEMMADIFAYIDRCVNNIVKPRKKLYMAIDGVAPRAKLNQQRARRFRSGKERMEYLDAARQRGMEVDESKLFDSNCITPGTEFMAELDKYIRYYIEKKMKEDSLWRNIEVIYSGHDVPGEGEHKIMQYIREERSKPGYMPNQRHCIYGQDADLIMLALATHEPHFTVLREEAVFSVRNSRKTRQQAVKGNVRFHLVHLGILRDYLEIELTNNLSFKMNRERMVDDFILMTFLVGNDFLPHSVSLNIADEAIETLFDAYRSLYIEKPGYIVENGKIVDFERLESLCDLLSNKQRGNIEEGKRNGKVPKKAVVVRDYDAYRNAYYSKKLKFSNEDMEQQVHALKTAYVEGLMWCLSYYMQGCVSWNWYFPYHYAPLMCDMNGVRDIAHSIQFQLGEPFHPFEQLLGCLPPTSKRILPPAYLPIMEDTNSSMYAYYPMDFPIDMEGKSRSFEAVVLLPFIDEQVLKAAANAVPLDQLTDAEQSRNQFGASVKFNYDVEESHVVPAIGNTDDLGEISESHVRVQHAPYSISPQKPFSVDYIHGTTVPLLGYPSIHGAFQFKNAYLSIVPRNNMHQTFKTLVLELDFKNVDYSALNMAPLLGRTVYINFPFVQEVKIGAVSTEEKTYRLVAAKNPQVTENNSLQQEQWKFLSRQLPVTYLHKGLAIGDIKARVKVNMLCGTFPDKFTGKTLKIYSNSSIEFPLQLALWRHPITHESPSVWEPAQFKTTAKTAAKQTSPNASKLGSIKKRSYSTTAVSIGRGMRLGLSIMRRLI